MSGSRMFMIVLILFALLFAAGVGAGLRQNDSQPDPHSFSPPNWSATLSDWLSPKLSLNTLQAVQGTCLKAAQNLFTLTAGSRCVLNVPSSSQQYRRAKLHLVSGTSISVAYSAPPSQDPNLAKQRLSWPGADPQSFVALPGGGTLTISCASGAACELQAQ